MSVFSKHRWFTGELVHDCVGREVDDDSNRGKYDQFGRLLDALWVPLGDGVCCEAQHQTEGDNCRHQDIAEYNR